VATLPFPVKQGIDELFRWQIFQEKRAGTMPPIISFIGWHDSGKTTLASQVVSLLKARGYRIAVIKSTKESGLRLDREGTDTHAYRAAGADAVTLVAPDQTVLMSGPSEKRLFHLAHRYFPDMDLVIGEGFKDERQVAKIEVRRGGAKPLRGAVTGVIAVATDQSLEDGPVFGLDMIREITDFIEERLLSDRQSRERATLLVDGKPLPLPSPVQEMLARTVTDLVGGLKSVRDRKTIELRIRTLRQEEDD